MSDALPKSGAGVTSSLLLPLDEAAPSALSPAPAAAAAAPALAAWPEIARSTARNQVFTALAAVRLALPAQLRTRSRLTRMADEPERERLARQLRHLLDVEQWLSLQLQQLDALD